MDIKSRLKCELVVTMTTVVDHLMEMMRVEMMNEKAETAVISCVYRSPGSCVETFTDKLTELLDRSHNKLEFLCGDFNIDLKNPAGLNSSTGF